MERSTQFRSLHRGVVFAAIVVLAAGCSVTKQEAPSLTGPSGFAQSLIVTAAPQVLARDGSSMSTISVTARNADGSPMAGRRLLLSASAGTLQTNEVLTGNDGRASVVYIAPDVNEPVAAVTIRVTPVEAGDRANTHGTSILLEVRGPDVPTADFTSEPTDAAVLDLVAFDASNTRLGTGACLAACSYTWDFGDGSNGSGLGVSHAFSTAGVFNVTLTATSLQGTSGKVTKAVRIAVPPAPQADLSINPISPTAGVTIVFSSASVVAPGVTIARHVWDLGNGAPPVDTGTASSYTFTGGYTTSGTYQVTLTITDNYGRTSKSAPRSVDIP